MTDEILCAALGAGLFATLVGLNARYLGRLLGLLDFPDAGGGRKRHAHVTPLLGGTAVLPPVILLLFAMSLGFGGVPGQTAGDMAVIGCIVAVLYVLGMTDDRLDLSPRFRLIVGCAAFALGIIMVPALDIQELRFTLATEARSAEFTLSLPSYMSGLFTLVCMVGLLNAVNMADGKNGLVIGLCLLWTAMLFLYAPASLQGVLLLLGAALGAALFFNLKGRFFLGDGGSYGLSALFGTLAIYIYNQPESTLTAGAVAVWFLMPVLDCLRLMVTRTLKGRSPFSGDRDHLHHHLGYLLGWPNGLLVYWLVAGVPSVVVYFFPTEALQVALSSAAIYTLIVAAAYRRQAVNAG